MAVPSLAVIFLMLGINISMFNQDLNVAFLVTRRSRLAQLVRYDGDSLWTHMTLPDAIHHHTTSSMCGFHMFSANENIGLFFS